MRGCSAQLRSVIVKSRSHTGRRAEPDVLDPGDGNYSPGERYRIILCGDCGPLVAGLFGDAAVTSGHGYTHIIVTGRGDSGIYGLLDLIQDLALHLVSLNELGDDAAA